METFAKKVVDRYKILTIIQLQVVFQWRLNYKLAVNITKLADINELPFPMDIDILKSGVELGRSLFEQNAVYDKKCKKKFE